MRVLLIDRDESFRHEVTGIFASTWPGSSIEHYDPDVSGRPGPAFALSEFDLVILDNRLGAEDGLEWLRDFTARPGCPPTVMLAGQGSENVAVRAMKLGAYDYLPKQLLTKESLEQIVTQALGSRSARADATQDLGRQPAAAGGLPQIEGYRLVREVGCGAVSRVYLMQPEAGGTPVIAKVLFEHLLHDSDFLERFLREYHILGRIRSPYVGKVFGYGFSDNSAYLLMEYLNGGDVRAYFTGNYVDQVRILRIFRQVLTALKDIHAAGVIHRDLKPHNVMFREDQSLAMVDFGIAKVADLPGITLEGTLLGTPIYMSPEVIRGRPADPRSDLYSAGVMLYQMIAKAAPFNGTAAMDIIEQHLNAAPPPLPRAHDEFQPLIDSLLAKDPDARPASAEAALKLIEELYG
ncbi:MAG TPA: protein kinase [Burkholderiales bacterium]|nr:protein kinase [Burkholderiales bacterium]